VYSEVEIRSCIDKLFVSCVNILAADQSSAFHKSRYDAMHTPRYMVVIGLYTLRNVMTRVLDWRANFASLILAPM